MLNVTDKCFISPAAVKSLPAIREIICVFLRHKGEAPSLSAHCKKKFRTEFTLLSFPFASFYSLGWRVCPLLCLDRIIL